MSTYKVRNLDEAKVGDEVDPLALGLNSPRRVETTFAIERYVTGAAPNPGTNEAASTAPKRAPRQRWERVAFLHAASSMPQGDQEGSVGHKEYRYRLVSVEE